MPEDRAIGSFIKEPAETIRRGKNYLFAIGISTYKHFPRLINARKDIEDLAKILVDSYSFNESEVQLICDDEANRANIVDRLDGLRNVVHADDRLLIYYSGHGYFDEARGFWIPVDAERGRISSYISNADVLEIIKNIKARHILLISDSCFSGSLLYRDISATMANKAIEAWDRDPSRFAFVSGKGPVSDGIAGENSPFADGIIRQLRNNDQDAINIVRLADQVTQEIRYNYDQQAEVSPLQGAGHKGGQYVFFKKGKENLRYNNLNIPEEKPTVPEDYSRYVEPPISPPTKTPEKKNETQQGNVTNQKAEKIYNIDKIDNANFS